MHVVEDEAADVGERRRKRRRKSKSPNPLKEHMGALAIAAGAGGLLAYFGLKHFEKKEASRREAEDLARARDAERIAKMLQPLAGVAQLPAANPAPVEAQAHRPSLIFSFMEED
jgi:hypothetical protein